MLQALFRRRNLENACRFLPISKKFCQHSEKSAVEEHDSRSERLSMIERYRNRKTYKKNFVENLFLGLFEPEVLEYPEIRTKQEVDSIREHGERATNLLTRGIDFKEIESTGKITKETIEHLQGENLMGMKIRFADDGPGYLQSESSFIQESLYHNLSLSKTVAEYENSSYQIIKLYGNELQKEEYLPKCLNGECVFCLAHLENGSWYLQDSQPITSTAIEQGDGTFVISGRKALVYNPNSSDFMIVSARVGDEKDSNSYTLFLVEKNSLGLSVLEPLDKFSLKGTEMCDVVFDKVVVSADKVIGKVNEGDKIIDKLLGQGKLNNGAQCIGVMRKLVNDAISHCIVNNHFNKPLHEYKYIQGKIGEIMQVLYAAESMTYLMNGRLDEDPNLDAKLESIIVKVFNSEALHFVLYNYMHLVGKDECNVEFIERLIRDSHFFSAFDNPSAHLKLTLGTIGVKYLLKEMSHRTVKKYRPRNILALKFKQFYGGYKDGELLMQYLHETLKEESELLGYCVQSLNFLTELIVFSHGTEILIKPYFLSQLADLTIIIYKLTAVLGRASRSYCIGLPNAETEIRIARNIAQNSGQIAVTTYDYILKALENEPSLKNVANYVSSCGKFCDLHPAELMRKVRSAA